MRAFLISAAIVALSGCASIDDVVSKAPAVSLATSKPAEAYSACVEYGWGKSGPVHRYTTETGFTVTVAGAASNEVVAVVKRGAPTTVDAHVGFNNLATSRRLAVLEECK
jgi:uncharacterized protein YceK